MKHAYLILAHNEFAVLKLLIEAIDDPRNDIFIHFDRKVVVLPELTTKHSNLYLTAERVEVRWGDVSVVEAEFALFEAANKLGPYSYYHLLSGVDMPLRSQDEIHDFFSSHQGKEFIGFSKGDVSKQTDLKVNRIHLFPGHFRPVGGLFDKARRLIRYAFLRLQFAFGIRRNKGVEFRKGTQWVSITHEFLSYVLPQKKAVLKLYASTFCSDEIFLQTLCWNSPFKDRVFDMENEGRGCQRMIRWRDNVLFDWTDADFEELVRAKAMFARKFNSKHLAVAERLLQHVKNKG